MEQAAPFYVWFASLGWKHWMERIFALHSGWLDPTKLSGRSRPTSMVSLLLIDRGPGVEKPGTLGRARVLAELDVRADLGAEAVLRWRPSLTRGRSSGGAQVASELGAEVDPELQQARSVLGAETELMPRLGSAQGRRGWRAAWRRSSGGSRARHKGGVGGG